MPVTEADKVASDNTGSQGMFTTYDGPISDSWNHDHLDRVQVAKFLTQYLDGIYKESDPDLSNGHFVLNLNASWGQGKTFLLTKWEEDLEKAGYPVVRFDAWANDFSRDPLVGFMSELYEVLDPWLKDIAPARVAMRKVKKSAAKVIGAGVGFFAGGAAAALTEAGLNMLTGKCDVSENTTDLVASKAADGAGKLADRALKDHKTTKKAIADFKVNLERLIKTIEGNKKGKKLPLYIFVDELDRCRPTYAIELLENIKHLFGVRGVFFVVATNKEQLCHSISAVYGSGFDSSAYLGRFFDQEYTLPEPDNHRFANHLFAKYGLEEEARLFTSAEKQQPGNHLARVFALLADTFELPLRDQEQTVHRIKAILATYRHDPVYFDYLVFLLMLRKKSEPLFDELEVEYVKDRPAYETKLSKIFRGHKVIKVPKISHDMRAGLQEESWFSLIYLYVSMAQKDFNNISKRAGNIDEGLLPTMTIYREVRNNNKLPSLSISEYPKLVRQVGQLS